MKPTLSFLATLLIAGCASAPPSPSSAQTSVGHSKTRRLASISKPAWGDGGVSKFYSWKETEISSAPGTLLRKEKLPEKFLLKQAASADRLLYVSTDGVDGTTKIAVSGSVFFPQGEPPADGWPVVAWAHGTVGIADVCAPSWRGRSQRDTAYLNAWLKEGFVVVSTDYQGLGTAGLHPYMLYRPEAYSVLDSARALIKNYKSVRNSVILVGQSQGSGAALGAAQLAEAYAPEVKVLGTIATGLVVNLKSAVAGATQIPDPANSGPDDEQVAYSMLYLAGLDQTLNPEINLDQEVTDLGRPLLRLTKDRCLTEIFHYAKKHGLTLTNTFTPDRAKLIPNENNGTAFQNAQISTPIFTGTGLADSEAGTAAQFNFISDLCQSGSKVSWHYYSGLTHDGALNGSLIDSLPFARKLLAGEHIASNCDMLLPPGPLQEPTEGVPFNH